MRIAIGNDHAAVEMKMHVVEYLKGKGHEVVNVGIDTVTRTDYPDWAEKVADLVVSGEVDKGIVICGTGVGISISANKIHGIRCGCVSDPVSARLCRAHNNCNMIAFGARIVGEQLAQSIVDAFLETPFDGGRHADRVAKMMELENR